MAESRKSVAEIKVLPAGEKFSSVGVVLEIHEKKDKNGKSFWTVTLMDQTGSLEAKVWGNSQWWDYKGGVKSEIRDPASSTLVSNLKGSTIGVNGVVAEFKGKNQFNFSQVYLVDQEQDEYRPESFVQTAPIDPSELEERFDLLVGACSGEIGDFLRFLFDKEGETWKQFRIMPAAVSHHHAYVHGLLEHSITVAELALSMAKAVQGPARPDQSMVIAGALLHDLGKLEAYVLNPGPGMTVQGTVIDHIALGFSRFDRLADDFGLSATAKTALGHILLSHHGHREFGSPVLPATPEALVVSVADELDFKLFCWSDSVSQLKGGDLPEESVSELNYSAQRRFWKWRPDQEV
ncbi:MAG: HD domain-containing protein [Synergistales bacterium]|nr:HD domain-containing protein [Dethiosulfovibrio sp.]NCC95536.1 HD domain-containing protein [Synergistales bacterium]